MNGQLYGIGEGNKVAEADAVAMADISSQVNAWVQSETNSFLKNNGSTATKISVMKLKSFPVTD